MIEAIISFFTIAGCAFLAAAVWQINGRLHKVEDKLNAK
jgi:hypothetical protein